MRVTNNMLVNTLLRNVNGNLSTMQKQQDQLSTGKRVAKPSDDPVAVSKIIKYKTDINELEQYDTNTKDALSWTQTSELAITDISDALGRTRELAVQAANGTNTLEERENIAMEIEQLKEHIIGNGNKTFAGKYIFSSFQTDKKLLNADGSFNIDITQKEIDNKPTTTYEVGVGETMKVSTNGLDLFGAVVDDNFITQNVPTELNEGKAAKNSLIKGEFDLTKDYTVPAANLDITYNGNIYTVDETNLDGTTVPLTKTQIVESLKNADNAGNKLSEVANIYYDSDNKLVIQAKDKVNIGISVSSSEFTTEAAYTSLKGTFNLGTDYTGDDLDITFDDGVNPAIIYDIDESILDGSGTALTEEEVIDAYNNSTNAGPPATVLSDYADVFFKGSDLVIQPKEEGNINITTSAVNFTPTLLQGRDVVEASIVGNNILADADVSASTGTYDIVVMLNDKTEKISINMDSLNDVSDFNDELQSQLDDTFGIGKLEVIAVDGKPLEINTIGALNDGSEPKLEIRPIKSQTPQMIKDLDDFINALKTDDTAGISVYLGNVDDHLENINSSRSEIGAKTNRLEMILKRIEDDNINVTQLLSNNQDVDMAETIMLLKNAENVYKASLSAGARVIQPSLLDFLR